MIINYKMEYINKNNVKLTKRKKSNKKGDNGRVLIVSGSKDRSRKIQMPC